MTERTVMTLVLIDEDQNLPVENSLVHKFEDILTEDSVEVTIQQILVDNDIKGILSKHNRTRVSTIDKSILKRTGNKVYLDPITIKDLSWKVK